VIQYVRLLRLRIVVMVLFAMAMSAYVTAAEVPAWPAVLHALVGTALVIGGAVSLNQWIERRGDAQMSRTASRPLPAGQLTTGQVTRFGLSITLFGIIYLALFSSPTVTAMAAASWAIYVLVYTPMKSRSAWQTPVGAVSGAMPVLLGAAAVDALLTPMAAVLFGIVFLWQFPHSMAIAWLYRDQFAAAGVKLVTTDDPTGGSAGWVAVAGAIALLALSLTLPALQRVDTVDTAIAVVLGLAYLGAAAVFRNRPDDRSARWLLRASLVYLPGVLVALFV
jgi:protoheme IX farnesyltransferase